MSPRRYVGEFEHMVLLAILQCGDQAFALEVREEIARSAQRSVSRGAFYTTLERLEKKGFIDWVEDEPAVSRAGPTMHRRYRVTRDGIAVARSSRRALLTLWRGLDELLDEV